MKTIFLILFMSTSLFADYEHMVPKAKHLPGEIEEDPIVQTKSGLFENSPRTRRLANRFARDIEQGRLAEKTDSALDAIIRLAAYKLHRVGKEKESEVLLEEWEGQWRGYVVRYAGSGIRNGIGSHRPLSDWLAQKTMMLELALGKEVMHALRLDDLITINYALPVCFRCIDDVDESEYRLHFVSDPINGYRGLMPVIIFWVTEFSCVGFTWGSGFLFCSPIAMGTEFLTLQFVAPKLNNFAWRRACKKENYNAQLASTPSNRFSYENWSSLAD